MSAPGLGHAQQSQVLHNHVRPEVSSGKAALVRALPLDQRMNLSIILPLRNQAELDSLVSRLYDPSSPDFHHFLTVDQFTAQFGPTTQDYQAVVAFAQAHGFTVTGTPANRLVVPFNGTVDQVEAAFGVRMNVYQHPTEDRTFFSPDREPSVDLSVPVAHISGLSNFSLPRAMVIPPPPEQPQIASVTGSGPGGSYLGSDMRAAYYGGTALDGNGQAVGLLEYDGYNLSDVTSTFSNAGQTYNVAINNVLLDGATGAPTSGYANAEAEVVLDIVQAIGMAPGLQQVRVYIGSNDADLLNSMASENIAKQISCSWSWVPDDPSTDDPFFKEFAAQGQSFFAASGDYGAYDASISPYFYPQEDAYITAVGGTHLNTNGAGGAWASETAWNSSPSYPWGSGGGVSPDDIAIPGWQSGVANTSNGGSTTLRNIPDVAMEGDIDNYACTMGSCSGGWSGTSFAAPRWAGFTALINEQAVEAGNAPNGGIGFINPSLYTLAESTTHASDFHDITSGNNDTYNQPVSYSAVAGYDLVTGWGSPAGKGLIDDLAGPQVPGFWIIGSPATVNVTPGSSSSTTVSVSDAGGFTGNVTLAVSTTLPTGVTASWGTNPTAGSSVLTLTADNSATASTTPLTITGTSGTLKSTATVTLAVHTPTFALTASPSALGINQGSTGTETITVLPEYGFTGSVNLSVSGLPSGVTAAFSPASTTGTSTLTLNVSSSAAGGTSALTVTGTSGNLSVTSTFNLTVQVPSFTLSTASTVNIGEGSSTFNYVYVIQQFGFTGNVNLSVSGLPSGVTAAFVPNPATTYSGLTLTSTAAAVPGQSTITVTGTSGSLTASTTFTLVVHQPTFTLLTVPSLDMGQGASSSVNISISPQYGFTGNVTFSVAGLPTGVTALWNPNPGTSYGNLTLTASSSAAVGASTLTVTGTSGSITQTTTLTLNIHAPSFTVYDGGNVNMGQGTTTTSYVSIYPQYGFTGNVTFSVTGLPSGVTAAFSPNPTTGSSTLTLTASSTAALGTKTVTITGTSGTLTASTTMTLGVYTPTFTISTYTSVSIGQGTSGSAYVFVNSEYGFTGSVNFSVAGLPSGVTASFSPNPATGSSTLTLTASSTAVIGQSTLTITGTSGSQTATTTLSLGVFVPAFTISSYGSVALGQGTSTTAYVSVNPQYGFNGSVTLSVSGLPAGVTAAFSPNPATNSSTLTLTAGSTAATGQYSLTIMGTSGTQTATTTLSLGVYAPTFTLTAYGVGMGQGTSATTSVYVNSQYGFSGSVNLSVSGLPSGVTASFSPNPIASYYSTLTLTTNSSATPGQYTLTVTGTSGTQTATATMSLVVYAPSFTIYSSAYSLSLNQGATGLSTMGVTPQYGFTGSVTFSVSGLPSGVTASFSPNPSTSSSTLTFSAGVSAAPVTSTLITITGTSGTLTASTTLYLTVNPQGFTLIGAPGEISLAPGGSGETTIAVIPQNGFSESVNFAATNLPAGITAAFSPNPTTGSSVLILTAGSSAAAGSATVGITGISGSLTAATSVAVKVSSAAPTATTTTLQTIAGGSSVKTVAAGTVVTLSASVSAGSTALKSGQIRFCNAVTNGCDSSHLVGSAQLTRAGTATLKFIPGVGVHSYQAVFTGSTGNAGSSSSASNLTVTAALPSTTTLAQSGTAGNYTLTATVTGQGAVAPTGTVSFLDATSGNSVLGTATLGNDKPTIAWGNPQSPATGQNPDGIAVGDFNGDGIPDIAVANSSTGTLTILLGKGDGTFTATASSPQTGSYPRAVVVGDFNGDGIPDLAVSNSSSNSITILLGNGDGSFTPSPTSPTTGSQPGAMAVGDFNGDGILDLAILNAGVSTVTIQLGNGDGTFTPSPLSAQTGSNPIALAIGDFNGDGVLDLAVLNSYSSSVSILLGNGDGSFTPGAPVNVAQYTYPYAMVAGDFNQDGKLDLAVGSNSTTNPLTIFLGNGDGTFTATAASPASLSNPTTLAVADFNGDGKPDLVESNNSQVAIQVGNGDGTFAAASTLTTSYSAGFIVAGDFDGDGTQDLAFTSNYNNIVNIFTSQINHTVTATATGISPAGTGTHNAEASYPGDTGYKSSISTTVGLTAELVTPNVTVTPSASSITTSQALTVTVTVAGSSNNPIPTGSVTLTSGSYTSSAAPLTSGGATINIPSGSLTPGNDTLTVTYTPDTSGALLFSPSTGSAPVTVTTPARVTPTVTVTPTSASITTAQTLTVVVTVAGGSGNPTPTGSVVLTSGGYTSTAATLTNGGTSINVPAGSLATGSDPLTVTYTPDSSSSLTYNSATGTNSVTVTAPPKTTPTVAVTPSSSSITTTQALNVVVTVAGGSGNPTPTGSVALTGGGYTSPATVLSGGGVTISISAGALATGTDTLTVTYTPDSASSAIYNPATGTTSVAVATPPKITPTVAVTPSASNITTAQALVVTVSVAGGAGNPTPTGSVVLASGGYTSPAATLSGGGATINVPAGTLATGTDTLTAAYTPDTASSSSYNPASGSGAVTVTTPPKTAPAVTVTPSASSITTTQALAVTVMVAGSGNNPTPSGSVVLSGGSYTSPATTLASGVAVINIPAGGLAAGTDVLTAAYTPDSSSSGIYNTAAGSGSVAVSKVTPTVITTPSAASITSAQGLSVTVMVRGDGGISTPTGSVVLTSGGYTSSAASLSNGGATINIPAGSLSVGTDTLAVAYTPDSPGAATYNNAAGTGSVTVTQAIGTTAATVTVSPSASAITNLQQVTVTVTVAGPGGQLVPTGNVILSGGSYSAQQALSGGAASFTIVAGTLGNGANTLTAAYSGDPTYAIASASVVLTVAPVLMTTPTLTSVAPGSSAGGNVMLTAGSNYSGTMSLSCTLTSSPAGAQSLPNCSLNPTSLAVASGGTGTAALSITTTAASTASLAPPGELRLWKLGGAGSLLAFVLMFGIPARRRRWASMLVLLLLITAAGVMGCGGGSGSSTQPPPQTRPATTAGNYVFTMKATDAGANVTASANVSLTVQ